ncbi:exopolysaccharide biosynthesis polyprenyl glycosylphosphotransferase, partial [Patescibacteria group bacterium]|nr:exopolysaccharide biosynthesis polyprenyl glycosylphosphotransferase [Patescibacteria group bacterium]
LSLIQKCEDLNVRFKVVSGIFEIVVGDIDLNDLEGIPSLDLKKRKSTPIYDFLKRVMDIILSIIGLILFAPFWLLITIIIRFIYKSSAIFTHNRVGKNGKIFKIYKFRTMHKDVKEEERSPANSNDPRVTKLGRFLRKTSIDEIPQLINIIKGEMSWVGPRPEMPFIVEKYTDWQRRRLEVKPGLTGLWQILGRKDLPMHENIEYDFYYIKNRSILLDIIIILKTIGVVLSGKGAY